MWITSTPDKFSISKILRFDSLRKRLCRTRCSRCIGGRFGQGQRQNAGLDAAAVSIGLRTSYLLTHGTPCNRWCPGATTATLGSIHIWFVMKTLAKLFIWLTECQIFIWLRKGLKLLKSVQSSWFKFILNSNHKRLHSDLAPALTLLCNAVELFLISIYVKI